MPFSSFLYAPRFTFVMFKVRPANASTHFNDAVGQEYSIGSLVHDLIWAMEA